MNASFAPQRAAALARSLADQLSRLSLLLMACGAIDVAHLEFLLQSVEILQGRRFVDGSIKHYELVKEG